MESKIEKCMAEHTGSCLGCNILGIILEKGRSTEPSERVRLVERVRETLCSDKSKMIIPIEAGVKQSIW